MIDGLALADYRLLHVPELGLSFLGNIGADVELIDDRPYHVKIAGTDGTVDQYLAYAIGRKGDLEGFLCELVLRVILHGVG